MTAHIQTDTTERIFERAEIRSASQPIVDLDGGGVVGVEALARWPISR